MFKSLRRLTAILACAATVTLGAASVHAAPRTDLVLGMSVEPAGLDPTVAAPVAIGQVTWQNLYEGLVRIDRNGQIQPQLAKSWTVSPDGLSYTFALQTGVSFHDGEPFDSAAAKFSLDRARGEKSVNPQKQFYSVIDRIETPDGGTLVLHLKKPAANLLYWLGWPASVMVAPKAAETARAEPVGTGPFRFESWAKGDRVVLARNPNYWNASRTPKLDRVTFRFLSDPQAQAAAMRAGDLDAMPEFSSPELFELLKSDQRFTAEVGQTEMKVVAGMNSREKPFSDPRVRQALMMAVDRMTLIEGAYGGFGQPIGSHYTPNDPGYLDLTATHPFDPEKAKALLAEAGYGNGLSFTIKTPQMAYATRSSELLQAMFAEIGVTLTIEPTEFPARWVADVLKNHDFAMTIVAHAEPMDIAIYARPDYYFGYRNPAFDAAIEKAESAPDEATRLAAYGEAQKLLASDVPALYLFTLPKLGVWNAKLEGFWSNEPIPSNDLSEVRWTE
ncbi:ABC transporter substrate-binding protein [Aureimonas psammosilenae]|uniref:ABC transporter substrate-binding protein n=1 Tax=Aureimonas psammosilenae TaxID=2495496 RepID=UPI001260831E|nr:ABC transporter substrate-binding protein [Aureimonas psammosilenae]